MRTIEVVMAQIPNSGSNLLGLALAHIAGLNTIVGIYSRHTIRRLKATGTFHELSGWNEVLLFWFTNFSMTSLFAHKVAQPFCLLMIK